MGIAYDWVSDRLYWTDETNGRIMSARNNGSERLFVVASSRPRAIVVHPCKGFVMIRLFKLKIKPSLIQSRLLFWSDVGYYPSIRRSTLTGRQVTYIITTNIRWPNGLTIDFDDDRIYWADAYL